MATTHDSIDSRIAGIAALAGAATHTIPGNPFVGRLATNGCAR
jgi:hypothetical protein